MKLYYTASNRKVVRTC